MSRLKAFFSILRIVVRESIILTAMFMVRILLFLRFRGLTEKCFTLLVHVWPTNKAEILGHFGWAYERSGNIEKAINCFQRAANVEPGNAMHYFDLGTLFEKKGNASSAIDFYEKALNLGGDFALEFRSQLQSKIAQLKSPRRADSGKGDTH